MTKHIWKSGVGVAAALLLAACGGEGVDQAEGAVVDTSGTPMAQVIADQESLSQLAGAIESSGLKGVFEGEASYTLLAPGDDAFAALGKIGEGDGALVANILRGHIIPGAITPDAIKEAAGKGGGDVVMATFGAGELTFTVNGDTILVAGADGAQAKLSGAAMQTSNGVILPIDAVLADGDALKAPSEGE